MSHLDLTPDDSVPTQLPSESMTAEATTPSQATNPQPVSQSTSQSSSQPTSQPINQADSMVGLKIAVAQQQFIVGDVINNAKKMVELAKDARDKGANIIVFPELSLLGYPPEDLLIRPSLASRVKLAFELLYTVKDIVMLVGYPHIDPNGTFNSVAIIHNGQQKGFYHKQCLPNYGVFDERRYFNTGHNQVLFDYQGLTIGLLICEDLWQDAPIRALKEKVRKSSSASMPRPLSKISKNNVRLY